MSDQYLSGLHRLDPPNCGCGDCVTGYSKRIDEASDFEIDQMRAGALKDATGLDWSDLDTRVRAAARQVRREAIREVARNRQERW